MEKMKVVCVGREFVPESKSGDKVVIQAVVRFTMQVENPPGEKGTPYMLSYPLNQAPGWQKGELLDQTVSELKTTSKG